MFEKMKALILGGWRKGGTRLQMIRTFMTGTTVKRLDRRQVFSPEG